MYILHYSYVHPHILMLFTITFPVLTRRWKPRPPKSVWILQETCKLCISSGKFLHIPIPSACNNARQVFIFYLFFFLTSRHRLCQTPLLILHLPSLSYLLLTSFQAFRFLLPSCPWWAIIDFARLPSQIPKTSTPSLAHFLLLISPQICNVPVLFPCWAIIDISRPTIPALPFKLF